MYENRIVWILGAPSHSTQIYVSPIMCTVVSITLDHDMYVLNKLRIVTCSKIALMALKLVVLHVCRQLNFHITLRNCIHAQ